MLNILAKQKPKKIYNADVSGLFFQMPPKTMHDISRENSALTVTLCVNMDGSNKCALFVIGKSIRPWGFQKYPRLPVMFITVSKIWMTRNILEQ